MTNPETAAVKRLSQIGRAAAAVLMIAALAGCADVTSKYPLSSPKSAVPDHSLEGMWKVQINKGAAKYAYVAYGKHGVGIAALLGSGSSNPMEDDLVSGADPSDYLFFVTKTPRHSYLNLFGEIDPVTAEKKKLSVDVLAEKAIGQPDAFFFMEYHFNWLGKLVCDEPDVEVVGKAVESGKLKGKVDYDDKHKISGVHLTDTSSNILNFFESTPGAFKKGTAWTRIGSP